MKDHDDRNPTISLHKKEFWWHQHSESIEILEKHLSNQKLLHKVEKNLVFHCIFCLSHTQMQGSQQPTYTARFDGSSSSVLGSGWVATSLELAASIAHGVPTALVSNGFGKEQTNVQLMQGCLQGVHDNGAFTLFSVAVTTIFLDTMKFLRVHVCSRHREN